MCAWCRYTLGRFERTYGDVFEWTHGAEGVFIGKKSVFDICFASQPANFRVTKFCPRISLDPKGSPKETVGSYPFFCSIIERSALARCNVLIIRSKKEHSSDYLFSDLRAIHTTPHPTPPPTAPRNKKNKDTHVHAHVHVHVFVFVCVRVCVFVNININISHEKTLSGTRTFHDVYCSKHLTFQNG